MGKLGEEFMKIIGGGGGTDIIKGPQKKIIYIMTVLVTIGILMIFINNSFGVKTTPKTSENQPIRTTTEDKSAATGIDQAEKVLGQNLEKILGQIEGVGKVSARVNLASSSEYEYAVNAATTNKTTDEKDTKGANRTVTEVTKNGQLVLIKEAQGSKETPVVIKEIKPNIIGVIVIAEGAVGGQTKLEITEAVQTLYQLPAHKVTVLPMEGR